MKVIMLLGKTPSPSGEVDPRVKAGVVRGVEILRDYPDAIMVISGGATMRGQLSEADGAMTLVPENLRKRVLPENCSTSTKENVEYTRELLWKERGIGTNSIECLIVISSPAHKKGVELVFRRFWPEIMHRFYYVSAGQDTTGGTIEYNLIYFLRLIDPNNRIFFRFKKFWDWIKRH